MKFQCFLWSSVAFSLLPLTEAGISPWKLVSFLVGLALSNDSTCLHKPFPSPWLLWKTELLQINQPHENCSSCPGCCTIECCVCRASGSPREGRGRSYGMVCSERPSCHTSFSPVCHGAYNDTVMEFSLRVRRCLVEIPLKGNTSKYYYFRWEMYLSPVFHCDKKGVGIYKGERNGGLCWV